MKRILMLSLLSLCTYGQTSLDKACNNLIERDQDMVKTIKPILKTYDHNLVMITKRGDIQIFDLDTKKRTDEFSIDLKINDFVIIDHTIWAVSNRELHQISLETNEVIESYPTSYTDLPLSSKYERAKAITKSGDLLYIANGERSLAVFDTSLLKLVNERKLSLPQVGTHRSWVTGLSIFEGKIYVGIDNITYNFSTKKRALEGIAIYDVNSLERLHIVSIRQNLEAYHEPKLFTYKGSIISNNLFLYFFNDAKRLLKQKKITPQRRLYKFEAGVPIGTLTPYGDSFIGCFSDRSRSGSKFSSQKI